jgi:hypothetical protein
VGKATFVERALASVTIAHTCANIPERACDDYDVAAGAAEARAAARASIRD